MYLFELCTSAILCCSRGAIHTLTLCPTCWTTFHGMTFVPSLFYETETYVSIESNAERLCRNSHVVVQPPTTNPRFWDMARIPALTGFRTATMRPARSSRKAAANHQDPCFGFDFTSKSKRMHALSRFRRLVTTPLRGEVALGVEGEAEFRVVVVPDI